MTTAMCKRNLDHTPPLKLGAYGLFLSDGNRNRTPPEVSGQRDILYFTLQKKLQGLKGTL